MKTNTISKQTDSWTFDLDFLWIELTNKCNLKCIHCYADSSPFNELETKIDYSYWKKIINDAYKLGCRKIQFIGGEPTIYPYLNNLIEDVNNMGFEYIEVYTNGTIISDDHLKTFVKNNVKLAFSVYGHTENIHEQITKSKNSYKKTMNNISKAINANLKVRVSIIEMESNKPYIDQTIDFIKSNFNVNEVGVDKVREVGRGHKNSIDEYEELCGACWQGRLVINSDGDIYPCVFSRFKKLGNIEEGLECILNKSELKDFRKKVRNIDELRRKNLLETTSSDCKPIEDCMPYCGPNCTPSHCRPDWACSPNSFCKPF